MIEQQSRTNTYLASLAALTWILFLLMPAKPSSMIARSKNAQVDSRVNTKTWKSIFFPEIKKRARIAKLHNLETAAFRKNDVELRVWIGFGPVSLQGYVISRHNSVWRATNLRSISTKLARQDYQQTLPSPQSGWEKFWQSLVDEGLLEPLSDSSDGSGFDGESYVFEVRTGNSYKTYMYSNPRFQDSPEARRVTRIVQIIRDEFNISR